MRIRSIDLISHIYKSASQRVCCKTTSEHSSTMDLRIPLSLLVLAGSIGVITAVPIDCSVIRCLTPVCNPEDRVVTPPGQCCSICVPDVDCSAVFCPKRLCEEGETLEVPKGKCCPVCVPGVDCSAVVCLRPVCVEGEILEVPEGECCPVCVKEG